MSLKTILIVALSLICILLLIALLQKKEEAPSEAAATTELVPPDPTPLDITPESEELPRITITEAMVDKLYLGHSYEDIEALWGAGSDESESEYRRPSDGYTSPFTIVWHIWNNPNRTRVRLGFVNNKLERKEFYRLDGYKISNEIDLDELK
ncbi:MAG: hypothetical protein ACOYI9_01435 [Candidatus Hydrogenedentales bacterium]|jgi:hypothetical protein